MGLPCAFVLICVRVFAGAQHAVGLAPTGIRPLDEGSGDGSSHEGGNSARDHGAHT